MEKMKDSNGSSYFVDLHLHTTRSDGTLSPKELVGLASRENIGKIAITDHDTVEGVQDGQQEASRLGLECIAGIEVSSRCSDGILHILGYGIEVGNVALQDGLAEFQAARRQRNDRIVAKLRDLGIAIGNEELRQFDRNTSSPGRPHIASVLVNRGIVATMDEAFRRYLGKTGAAFVEKEIFSSAETIKLLHDAGGKAYVAHPISLKRQGDRLVRYIDRLCREGLDGIEVYAPSHSEKRIEEFRNLALRLNLGISAGSDFHGATKPNAQIGIANNGKRATSDLISV